MDVNRTMNRQYVQVKREENIDTVVCIVAPEHKVTSKGYKVELVMDVLVAGVVHYVLQIQDDLKTLYESRTGHNATER